MPRALLLSVRFHDGRYHGPGDWPPAPARLFQALVAGAARGRALPEEDSAALSWLETLDAPVIAAPAVRDGRGFRSYVPNNDLDAVGGNPGRVGEIRAPKVIRSRLFDAADPLLYAWGYEDDDEAEKHVQTIRGIAERLYQLGRGVDMAWASAELLDGDEIAPRLARHGGVLYRPNTGGAGGALLCPRRGSLASLAARFTANRKRFARQGTGKRVQQLFSLPPRPHFASIAYGSPTEQFLFDLRGTTPDADFAPWPMTRTAELVERLRDSAADRLKKAPHAKEAQIDRFLIGRGATAADKAARIRIAPLPSIGHTHADRAIRRVLIEVPPNCPIPADDVAWAFSGLDLGVDYETGEILRQSQPVLSPAEDRTMLEHYCVEGPEGARLWRTVTPAALPQSAARRRIDPSAVRQRAEQKDGVERMQEQDRAAGAVLQALRHAGIGASAEAIRVQREPFERRGERAEASASATRFAKERLWHVEITFAEAEHGPLIIGDGRYLGLGLMAPVKDAWRDVMVLSLPLETGIAVADVADLLRAVRRALMALSRDGKGNVPRLFSGHEPDGVVASSGRHEHVFLAGADLDGDGRIDQLIVAAPWACDRAAPSRRGERAQFDRVTASLKVVRAGRLGVIALGPPRAPNDGDSLIGPSRLWQSQTAYRPTRHGGRGKDLAEAIERDVIAECERRGLPRPEAEMLELTAGPNGGNLAARIRLRFAVAVEGPILLGRDSHAGGGMFVACK